VTFTASGNVISNNALFALSGNGAGNRIWASGNTVSGNGTGFLNQSGSIFESAGDNAVRNNGANSSGTISLVAPM
jgi:hypothetical protein